MSSLFCAPSYLVAIGKQKVFNVGFHKEQHWFNQYNFDWAADIRDKSTIFNILRQNETIFDLGNG